MALESPEPTEAEARAEMMGKFHEDIAEALDLLKARKLKTGSDADEMIYEMIFDAWLEIRNGDLASWEELEDSRRQSERAKLRRAGNLARQTPWAKDGGE